VRENTNKSHQPMILMAVRKNEPKPSLIVIMVARTSCVYNKQAPER